jgi:hypothetical protein
VADLSGRGPEYLDFVENPESRHDPADLRSRSAIAMARMIYGIEDPSNPQLTLF